VKRTLAITIGALVGGIGGYFLTAFVCCHILCPESNLCGLPAVFVGAPLGFSGGWIAGAFWAHMHGDD
jgi:hypothetical protein